jgi:hypothetical protein
MTLQDYLSEFFYSRAQLLSAALLPESVFDALQQAGVMPKPSYVIRNNLICSSFFGEHEEATETQYYARQYVQWLGLLKTTADLDAVSSIFRTRYRNAIDRLLSRGFTTRSEKVTTGLDAHIDSEWTHFIRGTYGVCTKSGLPEDIAAKEIAVIIISELLGIDADGPGDPGFRKRLGDAVDLLDDASSDFAPHEHERSSRTRLVDQVRAKYRLDSRRNR